MVRLSSFIIIIVFIITSNAFAGFSSYSSPYSSDSVIAPIQIKEKGIYNLVISIQFLNEPHGDKVYKSDGYAKFIERLQVEWAGITLSQILRAQEQNINDLVALKSNIEAEISKLAEQLKGKYSLSKDVEVVFSLSNFYLLEPKTN